MANILVVGENNHAVFIDVATLLKQQQEAGSVKDDTVGQLPRIIYISEDDVDFVPAWWE